MENYIHLFETQTDFENKYYGEEYVEPWLSLTDETNKVSYNKSERELLKEQPLTFEIIGDGNIYWKASDSAHTKTLQYKLNDGEWTEITSATGSAVPSISVVSGDTVQFIGYNETQILENNSFSGTTCQFKVKGNIMSLFDGDLYKTLKLTEGSYNFAYLFSWCKNLVSAKDLILPSEVTQGCYLFLFQGCTYLVETPILPAKVMAHGCYCEMFEGCTHLEKAPELPSTTLADTCYVMMFAYCYSLKKAPKLPATTLASECYMGMFYNCKSLTTAPELPATTLTLACYASMFAECLGLTTAPELPATTLTERCYLQMFRKCTSLIQAPELPAETLTDSCYYEMFSGCTNLNYIKCLATDISASRCTNGWVQGVASTGTFVRNPNMSSWTTGINGIPEGWTIVDVDVS